MAKYFLNWSSGKDAAFALYLVQKQNKIKVEKIVTNINTKTERISMHGVRKELLDLQVKAIQIPLHQISLPGNISMAGYNQIIEEELKSLKKRGFTHSIFGDIFLEDLREYREQQLKSMGIKAVFPLWKKDTRQMMNEIIEAGFKAITVCVNSNLLDKSFCGREVDKKFLEDLPVGIDPCGENGEFHTFVYDGPIFQEPVNFEVGEVVEKFYSPTTAKEDCFTKEQSWDTSFWYCDLLPGKLSNG